MKDIYRKGFFAILVALLVGFICIPENSFNPVEPDLDNKVNVEQPVGEVSVQYAFEVSEISVQSNLSEHLLIVSLSESPPALLQNETFLNESVPAYDGIRDETLSADYWRETSQFRPLFSPMYYFT